MVGNARIVRKLLLFICISAFAIASGCSSKSIVGKWKAVERYDLFRETWEPSKDDVNVEFSADGKYKALTPGKLTQGTYTTNTEQTPNRLVLNDDKSGTFNAGFKVDEATLTLKGFTDARSEFPTTLDPSKIEPPFELIRFERTN